LFDKLKIFSSKKNNKQKLDKLKELQKLYNDEILHSIPHDDYEKIEKDLGIQENDIFADFEEFIMLIAGSCSYVFANKKVPEYQRNLLNEDFFLLYPQYSMVKESISSYPDFNKELENIENARKLILQIIETR
jgi:YxiJ-like protein